jgi:hypothetical protein
MEKGKEEVGPVPPPPHRSNPDYGNGDRLEVPAGKTPEEYTRISANAALNCEYAVGAMMRELASARSAQATFQTNTNAFITETRGFMGETRESFKQLGVKVRKSERRIEAKVEEIQDEVEDTKTRNLREFKHKYNFWKKTFVGSAIAIAVGVASILVAHYVFHVG